MIVLTTVATAGADDEGPMVIVAPEGSAAIRL